MTYFLLWPCWTRICMGLVFIQMPSCLKPLLFWFNFDPSILSSTVSFGVGRDDVEWVDFTCDGRGRPLVCTGVRWPPPQAARCVWRGQTHSAVWCQPPIDSAASGRKTIPCCLHSSAAAAILRSTIGGKSTILLKWLIFLNLWSILHQNG